MRGDVSDVPAGLPRQIGAAYPQYDLLPVPQIHLLTTSNPIRLRCGEGIYACAAMTGDDVFVSAHLDFEKREAQAVLLHELFHCVQSANGDVPPKANWRVLENEASKTEKLVDGRIQ